MQYSSSATDIESLFKKIHRLDQHFRKVEKSEKERLLERIVKLNEEVGELCEAALCEVDENQRKKDREIDFDGELADVVLCALMLSTQRNSDVFTRIHATLDKNLTRFNI